VAGFSPAAHLIAKLTLCGVALAVPAAIGLAWALPRSDYWTRTGLAEGQPVPFSHKHHVGGLGLDCRYCHVSVETASTAGMPSSDTCMTCHSQIWTNAPMLAPVRQSLARKAPLRWRRINDLPDYVFFDHSIHIAKGVGCETCHGRVDEMPLTWRTASLHMSWCLDCHRDPAPNLRPRDAVFAMGWRPGPGLPTGKALIGANHIVTAGLTDCTVCHR
jgi:hypothetical protein